jgi:hypothetical protein
MEVEGSFSKRYQLHRLGPDNERDGEALADADTLEEIEAARAHHISAAYKIGIFHERKLLPREEV